MSGLYHIPGTCVRCLVVLLSIMGSPYLFPGEAITTEILTIIHWAQRRNQLCLKYFHRNKVCDCTDRTICIGDIKQSYICVGCYKRGLPFFYLRQPYFSHRQFCHKLRRKSKSKFRKKKKTKISTRNPKEIMIKSKKCTLSVRCCKK